VSSTGGDLGLSSRAQVPLRVLEGAAKRGRDPTSHCEPAAARAPNWTPRAGTSTAPTPMPAGHSWRARADPSRRRRG
jgi:hypothetical protein